MNSTSTKKVTFASFPEYQRPLTPPLSPSNSYFNKTISFKQDSKSNQNQIPNNNNSSNKLRRNRIPSSLQIDLALHPLPLNSYSLLDSPTSPISARNVDISSFPTINTRIDTEVFMELEEFDVLDYSTFSDSSSVEEEITNSNNITSDSTFSFLNRRRSSLLTSFPTPPSRFSIKSYEKVVEAETKFVEAKRRSFELDERLYETGFNGILIENQLNDIKFRLREIKREERN